MVEFRLDPWGSEVIREYNKLFKFFGIKPFKEVLKDLSRFVEPHMLMRRGIVFGHRDFEEVIKALENHEKFAILTGLMPSGRMHLGHKMVIDQVIFYQNLGAEIFIAIADAEAYAVRKLGRSELIRLAIEEYVANYLALGLKTKNLHIYFQTNYSREYYRLIQLFSRKVSMAELRALYGEDLEPGKIISVLTQAADILHPQLKHFGGFKVVLVPVGADQDPHLRLSRDIADRFSNELGLRRPASTYHRFMTGLDGGKMSSSRPESYIALTDDPEEAGKKIMRSLTGGQATAEEQRKLGGHPEKCPVYEVNAYHLISDDRELENLYWECRTGKLLCGECKARTRERLIKFLTEHQRRLKSARELAYKVVEVPDF
ncbi:MAG: tryptophan--tRNA ligase [Thermoprotei archaeon]|nr:MAG: tryptophan--tRNA ligase [Thermoprotei archaeon]